MTSAFLDKVKFNEQGLVPAIALDVENGRVLMQAWQNREALEMTLTSGYAHYFSRSRKSLWKKGETSGHLQRVVETRLDCDGDSVLLRVLQTGAACHTGHPTCFFVTPGGESEQPAPAGAFLSELYATIVARRDADQTKSYVKSLFAKGPQAIYDKITEESGELIDASERELGQKEIIHEAADLWFHSLVLLAHHAVEPAEVMAELQRRSGVSGLVEKASREPK